MEGINLYDSTLERRMKNMKKRWDLSHYSTKEIIKRRLDSWNVIGVRYPQMNPEKCFSQIPRS